MILLLRLVLFLGFIGVFIIVPPLMLGFFLARNLSWWTQHDKIKGYIHISSPKLSKRLIPQYRGYHTRFVVNIPALCNQFYINENPQRLSFLGAIDYVVAMGLSLFWVYHMVGYFFFGDFANPNIPLAILLLMGHAVVATVVGTWNWFHRKPAQSITKAQWKQWKKQH